MQTQKQYIELPHTHLDTPILTSTTARSFLAKMSLMPVFNSGADLLKFRFPTKRLNDVVGSVAIQNINSKLVYSICKVWQELKLLLCHFYTEHIRYHNITSGFSIKSLYCSSLVLLGVLTLPNLPFPSYLLLSASWLQELLSVWPFPSFVFQVLL